MSRRLLNRSRPPGAAGASSSSGAPATLPDYEPSSCPLNDIARRALGDLSNNRGTSVYESQLKESLRYLGTSVGDLHERLRARNERLDALRERREQKGTAKTHEEERLEAHIIDLGAKVNEMSRTSERAVRDVIDQRAELEDDAAVLGDLYTTAATANPNPPNDMAAAENDGSAGEHTASQQPAGPSTLDTLASLRASKKTAYNNLTPHQRYALNNDYAGFKKLWHDAAAGEDGPPLPDSSRWFRRDGQPVLSRVAGVGADAGADGGEDAAGEEDGSDDDVAVAREVLSIKCPLTLRPMKEPYSNGKCKHTFEKAAILDYLPAGGVVKQCPQSGCSQTFSRDKFEHDFWLDQAMVRRIQRAKLAEQSRDDMDVDEDDVDGGDENNSVVFGTQRRAPGRAVPKKEE